MWQTLTDDFWGLHKNMNCAFPLTIFNDLKDLFEWMVGYNVWKVIQLYYIFYNFLVKKTNCQITVVLDSFSPFNTSMMKPKAHKLSNRNTNR